MPSAAAKRLKRARTQSIHDELANLYRLHGGLKPDVIVAWAKNNPASILHSKFTWDDSEAAKSYRLWQARQIITEVEVQYPDGHIRRVYVSPMESRGTRGYATLVDVLSDEERRIQYLQQAYSELERTAAKYQDLVEFAGVRRAIRAAGRKLPKANKE